MAMPQPGQSDIPERIDLEVTGTLTVMTDDPEYLADDLAQTAQNLLGRMGFEVYEAERI